jgi:hypothetical protein
MVSVKPRYYAFLVLVVLFLGSLVLNWHQFTRSRTISNAVYNLGLQGALDDTIQANSIIQGKQTGTLVDAALYLSESAGEFMSTAPVLQQLGVDHIYGIGMRLEQVSTMLAHPSKYSNAQIQTNEAFVHATASAFQQSWNVQQLSKSKFSRAVDTIYGSMSAQERSQLYPLY